jgi:hypothetical protein
LQVEVAFNTDSSDDQRPERPALIDAARMRLNTDGDRDQLSVSEDFLHFCAAVPGRFFWCCRRLGTTGLRQPCAMITDDALSVHPRLTGARPIAVAISWKMRRRISPAGIAVCRTAAPSMRGQYTVHIL